MPMLDLQQRHAEVFRLRFGDRRGGNRAPRKLTDQIRVTSPSEQVCQAFTEVYGGDVSAFIEPKSRDRFEAYLPTTAIRVMVLPGDSLQQWWESYRGSVCERRCDGRTETKSGGPCQCDPDPVKRADKKGDCDPTTRVHVICPDVAVLGSGAFVTKSLIAAETLPQSLATAEAALARGVFVPATLRIVEHKGRNHFIFPVIDIVGFSFEDMVQRLEGGQAAAALGTGTVVQEPSFRPVDQAALEAGPEPSIAEQVSSVTQPPARSTRANAAEPIPATGVRPRTATEAGSSDAEASGDVPRNVCSRCRQVLHGAVERGGDGESRFVHKECPSSGGGEPGQSASAAAPPASPEPDPAAERKKLERGIHAEARKAFPDVESLDAKANKEERDARRHAVVRNITGGRTGSLTDCTDDELHRVRGQLRDVTEGRVLVVPVEGDDAWPDGWAVELAARVPDEAA